MCKQELESLRVSIIECYDENRDGKIEVSEMTKFLPVEDNFLLYFRSDCCLSDLGPSDAILKVDLKTNVLLKSGFKEHRWSLNCTGQP